MSKPTITTQVELRKLFWRSMQEANPNTERRFYKSLKGFSHNDYPTDTRVAFSDFVENMIRDGVISEALARRATL